ncbi:hypothetical protein [Enterobacter hormaechei]|uniref:hypothetical protein n=1 Tax=Enterobacter hormaechei TaxID=158836 RepID=UPI0007975E41|nr:hypothetical protein [Enterobacter hormaechei]CZX05797.1 Uncharacterised protein [Enterobacter hormaechei]
MSVKRYDVMSYSLDADGNSGPFVKYDDYAALEARCAALAAENAGLKEWSPNPHSASMFEAIEKAEKLMDDGMPELAMVEAFEILKMQHTPATDAFLAEVRAQGVEMFAKAQEKIADEELIGGNFDLSLRFRGMSNAATEFAANLRKGVQS